VVMEYKVLLRRVQTQYKSHRKVFAFVCLLVNKAEESHSGDTCLSLGP